MWACTQLLSPFTHPTRIPLGCCHMAGRKKKNECDIWKHEITIMFYIVHIKCTHTKHLMWNEVLTEKCYVDMVQVYAYVMVRLYHSNQLGLLCKGRLFIRGWCVECDSLAKYSRCLAYFLGNIIRKAKPIEFKVLYISSASNEKSF